MFGVAGFFGELHFKSPRLEKQTQRLLPKSYLFREDFYLTTYVIIRAKLNSKIVILIKQIKRDTGDIFTYKE